MTNILYVFWDSDNTLVNTAEHHWRKHVETLKTLGITLDDTYRRKIYENNGAQNWEWLTEDLGLNILRQDYLDKIDNWYFDHIDEIEIRAGVLEAIRYFDDNNIPQAVVSNGRRRSVMAALDAKDLSRHFKFILCKEDYTGRKPSPAPYLSALKKMEELEGEKISADTCLVVEDDPLGVQAGEAAGMAVLHRPIGDDKPFDLLIS
ncbi:MAG TPA: HAD family phosphatase [Alphaproteobacteria bacterium]|nr:HAD family phosphatase [Alphaproteobacteria bacterium]